MSVNIKTNVGYGITNALQNLSPQPIISKRNPKISDIAELGTMWINKATNAYYVATSTVAGATTWQAQATGAGAFAAVDVTGAVGNTLTVAADSVLSGDLTIAGNTTAANLTAVDLATSGSVDMLSGVDAINISTDAFATSVSIATGAGAKTTIVGSNKAGSSLTLDTPALTPVIATNGLSVTAAGLGITLPGPITITTGAGAPAGALGVNIGDLYIRTDAVSAVTRMYICDAPGTWVNVTMSA
jgi:hypothetical protein